MAEMQIQQNEADNDITVSQSISTDDVTASVDAGAAEPTAQVKPEAESYEVPLAVKLKTTDRELLTKYIQLERVKAASRNKAGDKAGARESYNAYKALEVRLTELNKSGSAPTGKSGTSVRRKPASTTNIQPVVESQVASRHDSELDMYAPIGDTTRDKQSIVSRLEKQIEECTQIAAQLYKAGDKQGALRFHKYKKQFFSDVASLSSATRLPTCVYQPVSYTRENQHLDLSMQDMQLQIVRAIGLNSADVASSEIDSYVSWDAGWPAEGMPNMQLGRGDTDVIKRNSSPEYNFSRTIRIDRTRTFQRYLERKRMRLEVLHQRGFLRKPLTLGWCQVQLTDLLTHAETSQVVDLMDAGSKRSIGAKLELCVRLRQPFNGPEVVTHAERWLFLSGHSAETGGSQSSVQATQVQKNSLPQVAVSRSFSGTGKSNVKAQSPTGTVKSVKSPAVHIASPTSAQPEATAKSDNLDELYERFENVELIVSNMVLEDISKTVNEQIVKLQVKKLTVTDDLQDLKQRVDLKMQLLVISVQSGQLTMNAYLQQVKKSIVDTKQMALSFKRGNNMDMAKRALQRVKIMQDEVAEAEASAE